MSELFLGVSWSYPLRLDADTGFVVMSGYEHNIEQSIRIILGTRKSERGMLPECECGIHDYVFSVVNVSTLALVENGVRETLTIWEPRIEVMEVKASLGEMEEITNDMYGGGYGLAIEIGYKVRSTNNRFNLVYPFYLTEGK